MYKFIDKHKRLPASYHELVPKLGVGEFITMAPDDGQFIKIEGTSEFKKKRYLTGKIKVLKERSSVSRKSWKWEEFQISMPVKRK